MFCETVEIDELTHLIDNLNNHKGAGPDNIGPHLLKEMSSAIIQPFLPRDAMLSAVYAVIVCLSVCLSLCVSVTLRYCIKTITQTTPHDSPMTLVFCCQIS